MILTPFARATTLLLALSATTAADRPATRPAPATRASPVVSSTHPALRAVDLRYSIYLARIEEHITITPDGRLRAVRTDGKSFGPNDADPKRERREIREGQLTPDQIADLAQRFNGWENLSDQNYGGGADGPEFHFRYGDKTITGGDRAPQQLRDLHSHLRHLATQMPPAAQ